MTSAPASAAASAAAPTVVNAVASSFVVWPRSELLGVGDDPVPHWAKVLLTATAQGTFKYPAGHARAGQLDESSTGVFKSWLMTTHSNTRRAQFFKVDVQTDYFFLFDR